MKVVKFRAGEHEALWSSFVANFPLATPYHTRGWAEVLRKLNFKEKSLMCFGAKGEVTAILPLWQVNRNTIVNSPWRDRADLLVGDQESVRHIYEQLCKIECDLVLKDWNCDAPSNKFLLQDYWITSVLDLTPTMDIILGKIDKSVHRNVKKAQKDGVEVSQSITLDKVREFYQLFKQTRKRIGVPIYPWFFLKNMFTSLKAESIRLYMGYLNKQPVGGIIILDSPKLSIYAYGASDYKYQSNRVNDLLFWQAIQDSRNLGKLSFDFGADSPGQISLLQFKKKWGTFQKPLYTLYKSKKGMDFTRGDFGSRRYSLHRRILRYLPAWVLIFLGSLVIRKRG